MGRIWNTSVLLCVAISLSITWMASHSYAAGQRERADFYGLFYRNPPSVLYPDYLKKCPSPKYANKKFMRPWFFALPLGNAHIGAMVFGETDVEEIQINEKTLWSGGPGEYSDYNYGVVNGNHKNLKPIQEVLLKERNIDTRAAQKVVAPLAGDREGFGRFQCLGSLRVKTGHAFEDCTDYLRGLDLNQGIVHVAYDFEGRHFEREYSVSYPDKVLASRWSASEPGSLNLEFSFDVLDHPNTMTISSDTIIVSGQVASNQMGFESRLKIRHTGGTLQKQGDTLVVSNADQVVVLFCAATDYVNKPPTYKGKNPSVTCRNILDTLAGTTYDKIKNGHVGDYRDLYDRVRLQVEHADKNAGMTTYERMVRYKRKPSDPELELLYFNFGRYLMITSSRPGALPANLQGIWNDRNKPAWNADYHLNINLQMNYWIAETCNLAECADPLIDYIDSLRYPGRIAARELYNARGWACHHTNNPFGYVGRVDKKVFSLAPTHGAWIIQHVWEHYAFSGDEVFLRDVGYPILKEAAQLWEDILVRDNDGTWVVVPSHSPEHGPVCVGCTYDQSIVWDLLTNCIEASEILDVDAESQTVWKEIRSNLSPLKIGSFGQLQEWKEDIDREEDTHRHFSHLLGAHPGRQISPMTTPELAKAVAVSLNTRGNGGGGWSKAWKANQWARLHDGDRALTLIRLLIAESTFCNLFDHYGPLQVDGNFGGANAFAEMLLQSHMNCVHLLPALPSSWSSGTVEGLCARGGFEVDMTWDDGRLIEAKIHSSKGRVCRLYYREIVREYPTAVGETIVLDGELEKVN